MSEGAATAATDGDEPEVFENIPRHGYVPGNLWELSLSRRAVKRLASLIRFWED